MRKNSVTSLCPHITPWCMFSGKYVPGETRDIDVCGRGEREREREREGGGRGSDLFGIITRIHCVRFYIEFV